MIDVPFVVGDPPVAVVVDPVADFHRAVITVGVGIVAIVAGQGAVPVLVHFVEHGAAVTVVVDSVTELRRSGIAGRIIVVAVNGTALFPQGRSTVSVPIVFKTGSTEGIEETISVPAVGPPVAVVIDPVGTDLQGAGKNLFLRIVTVVSLLRTENAPCQTVAVPVGIGTGAACIIDPAVTIVVDLVTADLDIPREASAVVIVAVTVTEPFPVAVIIDLTVRNLPVTIVVHPITDLGVPRETDGILIIAIGTSRNPVPVGIVGLLGGNIPVAVIVLAVADLRESRMAFRIGIVTINPSTPLGNGGETVAVTIVGHTNRAARLPGTPAVLAIGPAVAVIVDAVRAVFGDCRGNRPVGIVAIIFTTGKSILVPVQFLGGDPAVTVIVPTVTDLRRSGENLRPGIVTIDLTAKPPGRVETVPVKIRSCTLRAKRFRRTSLFLAVPTAVTVIVNPVITGFQRIGVNGRGKIVTVILEGGIAVPVLVDIVHMGIPNGSKIGRTGTFLRPAILLPGKDPGKGPFETFSGQGQGRLFDRLYSAPLGGTPVPGQGFPFHRSVKKVARCIGYGNPIPLLFKPEVCPAQGDLTVTKMNRLINLPDPADIHNPFRTEGISSPTAAVAPVTPALNEGSQSQQKKKGNYRPDQPLRQHFTPPQDEYAICPTDSIWFRYFTR